MTITGASAGPASEPSQHRNRTGHDPTAPSVIATIRSAAPDRCDDPLDGNNNAFSIRPQPCGTSCTLPSREEFQGFQDAQRSSDDLDVIAAFREVSALGKYWRRRPSAFS